MAGPPPPPPPGKPAPTWPEPAPDPLARPAAQPTPQPAPPQPQPAPPPPAPPAPVPNIQPVPPGPTGFAGPGSPPPIVGGKHGLPPKPLWRRPQVWAIAIGVLVALGVFGALAGQPGGATPTPSPSRSLRPSEPPLGKVDFRVNAPTTEFHSPTATIAGTAPVGSTVTLEGAGTRAPTDVQGEWSMEVDLEPGTNSLTFTVDREGYAPITVAVEALYVCCAPTSPAPTEAPTPAPTAAAGEFGDGVWVVGKDVKPGTYRIREPAEFCYWARLKGFSGDLDDIIANDGLDGWAVVTISKSDKGFETRFCGIWTRDLSQVTASKTTIEEGTLIVGTDVRPGTYRASGGESCYWSRLKGFGGAFRDLIENRGPRSRAVVTIRRTDTGFKSTGCGQWVRR